MTELLNKSMVAHLKESLKPVNDLQLHAVERELAADLLQTIQ